MQGYFQYNNHKLMDLKVLDKKEEQFVYLSI